MNFQSVEQVNQAFKSGTLRGLPDTITIASVPYHIIDSITYPIPDMVNNGLKAFVIYSVPGNPKEQPGYVEAKEAGLLDEWVVLIWAITPSLVIAPARAAKTTEARGKPLLTTGSNLSEANQPIIGDLVDVTFTRFGKTVKAKTDTGANMSSIHAEEWKLLPGKSRVEFRSSLLSDHTIQVNCLDQVVVKTSEGTEYRPVIALDISIEGKTMQAAQFNLNDRSHMNNPILIGQNVLEKGRFLVDPSRQHDSGQVEGHEVDWNVLQERFADITVESDADSILGDEELQKIHEMMLTSNASFQDVVRYIKTAAYKVIEETINY